MHFVSKSWSLINYNYKLLLYIPGFHINVSWNMIYSRTNILILAWQPCFGQYKTKKKYQNHHKWLNKSKLFCTRSLFLGTSGIIPMINIVNIILITFWPAMNFFIGTHFTNCCTPLSSNQVSFWSFQVSFWPWNYDS